MTVIIGCGFKINNEVLQFWSHHSSCLYSIHIYVLYKLHSHLKSLNIQYHYWEKQDPDHLMVSKTTNIMCLTCIMFTWREGKFIATMMIMQHAVFFPSIPENTSLFALLPTFIQNNIFPRVGQFYYTDIKTVENTFSIFRFHLCHFIRFSQLQWEKTAVLFGYEERWRKN